MGAVTTLWSVALAGAARQDPDPDSVTPGVAGFLVVFGLALVTILLIRSMTRHLRKVRYSPDPVQQDAPTGSGVTTPTATTPEEPARAEGTEPTDR